MNKKLLLGAALLAGFGTTLTSCVDSTESASVTNIRNAKAEQLKSIAELNNAQAKAAIILANAEQAAQAANQAYQEAQASKMAAEAEYLRAQAELLKAQALVEQAKADAMNAQTDADKQRLEAELAQKELERALLQAELDAKAEELKAAEADRLAKEKLLQAALSALEIKIKMAELDLATAQFNYDELIRKAQEAQDEKDQLAALEAAKVFKKYLDAYDKASKAWISAQAKLARDKAALMKLESGLEDAKQSAENKVAELKEANADLEDQIAAQNELIDFYSQHIGTLVTIQELWDAQDKVAELTADKSAAKDEYDDALDALQKASTNLSTSKYTEAVNKIINNNGWRNYYLVGEKTGKTERYDYRIVDVSATDTQYPVECRGKYVLVVERYNDYNPNEYNEVAQGHNPYWIPISYTPVFESADFDVTEVKVEVDGETVTYPSTTTNNYAIVGNGEGLDAWLDCIKKTMYSPLDESNLEDLEEQLEDAKEALTAAETGLTTATTALATATSTESTKKATLTTKTSEWEAAKKAYEESDYWPGNGTATPIYPADVTEAQKTAIDKLKTDYNNASTAYNTANTEYQAAVTDKSLKQTQLNTAKGTLYNAQLDVLVAQYWLDKKNLADADYDSLYASAEKVVADIKALSSTNDENVTAYNDAAADFAAKKASLKDAENAMTAPTEELNAIHDALWKFGPVWVEGNAYYTDWRYEAEGYLNDGRDGAEELKLEAEHNLYNLNRQLNQNKTQIENNQAILDKIASGSYENGEGIVADLIDLKKEEIALDEQDLETKKQLLDAAKSALENYVKSQE